MGGASSRVGGAVEPGGESRHGWRGRALEWRAVTSLLRAAEAGRGGAALVEGPSGIGKSRLLAEAVGAAAARGFMVAQGDADELRRLVPLAPLMSALGESTSTLGMPEGVTPSTAGDLRLWLVDQLRTRLEKRLAEGPHLLTLDDLQWADPTTLLALRSLLPELASYPLVWILARTSGSGGRVVQQLFETLEREGADRMRLEPLDDDAVSEVAVDVLGAIPEDDLLTLAGGAGGNPFLLVELLGGLRDEAAIEVTRGHARLAPCRLPHLPQRVQAYAHTRLDRLSPQARQLLQVAAVLGRSISMDDLADMLGEPSSRLIPAVEEALAAQILVTAGDTFTFRHDLLCHAVTAGLPAPMLQALHRQAGEVLLKRGGSAVPAAAHFMSSAQPGDTRALAGLDQAARELLPTSSPSAAELAVRALELTDAADPDRFDRTVTAIFTLAAAGRLTESAELARAALGQAPPEHAVRLHNELAYTLLLAGRPADAVAEAERTLSRPGLSDELRGGAEEVLFRGLFASHDSLRGRERAEAIIAAAEHTDQCALVGAYVVTSDIAWMEGRVAEGIDHMRQAVRVMAGDPIRFRRVHPRLFLATLLTSMRQFEEAETLLQAADEEIKALGQSVWAASPAAFRARLRLVQGRLDDAAVEAQTSLAIAEELGMCAFVLVGNAVLAVVAVRQGDLDAATGYVQRYELHHQGGRGASFGYAWGNWVRALVVEATEGPEKAIEVLHAPYTDLAERHWLLLAEASAAPWLTRTALAVADRPAAETIAATAERLADGNPEFPTLAASAAHAHGILHGDPAALARAAATHIGPWNRASAAEDLGVLLARTGSGATDGAGPEAAIRSLDQALDGYQRICAPRDAARVRARLRDLGVRRRHWTPVERPLSGWASLTETERTVATLVTQGLTNSQVATRMFISAHTVKFHLRQIFRKLDIGSRVELARISTGHIPKAASPDT
jgi:ATP/maltotriose-dependent transcriptional regulator MalT